MRYYEVLYIVNPQLEESALQQVTDRFSGIITQQGGELLHLERWDKRRLAHSIGSHREGQYILMHFSGEPAVEAELARVFRITDDILRFLIVRLDERKAAQEIERVRAEAAQRELDRQAAAARAAEAAAERSELAAAQGEQETGTPDDEDFLQPDMEEAEIPEEIEDEELTVPARDEAETS